MLQTTSEKIEASLYSVLNYDGAPRRVGFEIEYVGGSISETAGDIKAIFGGSVTRKHKNLCVIEKTELGDFSVELDATPLKWLAEKSEEKKASDEFDWPCHIEHIISSGLSSVIPLEIITPPVKIDEIATLNAIVKLLVKEQAGDTKNSLLSAFGLHINPELPSFSSSVILSFMQSFVLLYDWLKLIMPLDKMRQLTGFVDEYPREYCLKILDANYQPSLQQLILDYLAFNPSRNKALDMLPLFSYLDNELLSSYTKKMKINARPTFHYRLANSNFSDPTWDFLTEWQRWLHVESLAMNNALRQKMANVYCASTSSEWAKNVFNYIL